MLELRLQAGQSRSIFYGGYSTRIDATLQAAGSPLPDGIPLTEFIERVLQLAPRIIATLTRAEVVDESGKTVSLVENLRGRPRESFTGRAGSGAGAADTAVKPTEELFYSDGILFEPPANLSDYPESVEMLKTEPFSFSVETGFHAYKGSTKILHSLKRRPTGNVRPILESFDVREVLRLFPARLSVLRIGFEQYQPARFGSLLSATVAVHRRLYLECSPQKLSVFAEQTSGAKKGELPFGDDGLFPALDTALAEMGLFSGFSAQVQAAL